MGASGGSAEVQTDVVAIRIVDREEERRLTFGDRLHRALLELRRQRRQLSAELEKKGELVRGADGREVVDDLGQSRRKSAHDADTEEGTAPGSSPWTIGTRTALPHSVHEPS